MEFADVVMKRRAVRRFEEGGVEPEVIERIARLAQRTPSAGFSQGQRLVVVTDPDRRREVARICGEDEMVEATSGRGSASAPPSSSRASARRSTTAATRSPTRSDDDGTEIDWPVPFWWVDIGATMQTIMLAAVDEGLGCGFIGPDIDGAAGLPRDPGRVRPDRGHAGRPAAPRRPVAEPQARLGAVRGLRALGLDWRLSAAGGHASGRRVDEALAPDLRAAEERACAADRAASPDPPRQARRASPSSHASISRNSVQRRNGQPASRQIRTSDRFAQTTSP